MFHFNPKVSIIIPVYNGSNYLCQAIDSALAQTYSNVEIIVINDGSTDNTEKIALSYGEKIRYFSKKNGGVASALNLGLQKMMGEYFSWLSHDDIYLPKKIENQINLLGILDNKETVVFSGYQIINENSIIKAEYCFETKAALFQLSKPLYAFCHHYISGCTLLIHKSHFDRVGNFDTTLVTAQDCDMWFRILRRASIAYDCNCFVQTREHSQRGSYTIPQMSENCNIFWCKVFSELTPKEIQGIACSDFMFWADMYLTFLQYDYNQVTLFLKNRFEKTFTNTILHTPQDETVLFIYKICNDSANNFLENMFLYESFSSTGGVKGALKLLVLKVKKRYKFIGSVIQFFSKKWIKYS